MHILIKLLVNSNSKIFNLCKKSLFKEHIYPNSDYSAPFITSSSRVEENCINPKKIIMYDPFLRI